MTPVSIREEPKEPDLVQTSRTTAYWQVRKMGESSGKIVAAFNREDSALNFVLRLSLLEEKSKHV